MSTRLTIDLAGLAGNYRLLQKAAPGALIAGVIKADAYGTGMAQAAKTLEEAGCRHFFAGNIDEGVKLRAITENEIYIFDGIHSGDAKDCATLNLIPVLNSLSDIHAWKGPCAIHFDTGMNRLGLSAAEAEKIPDDLDVRLALSHFACSDEKDHPMNARQETAFSELKKRLSFKGALWSMCNSSGIFHAPKSHYDLVRPGYALYGGNPTPEAANPMHNVVTLEAAVLQVRDLKKGESIGYGATHVFDRDTQTATLCLGYADGFLRSAGGQGQVFWQGQPCPILGRVSMDLISIDIGHLPQKPAPGAMMEVIGPHQSLETLAQAAGTIGYEILTSLGGRYRRLYKEHP